MTESIDDLTVTYTEGGIETTKELDKVVLSRGSWATILYRYQDWDRAKNAYGPERFTIRRYQKRNGEYRQQSSPGSDLLSHGEAPHYHRRCTVSLLSSGWDQVVPVLCGRQEKRWQTDLRWCFFDPSASFGSIAEMECGCISVSTQSVWVLYGQVTRSISTG
jgi:hypothetical protein